MGDGTHALGGFALDNHSPVSAVTVRLGGHGPFIVAVDEHGRFSIPPSRVGLPGARNVVISARDTTGRTAVARLELVDGDDAGTVTAPVSVK